MSPCWSLLVDRRKIIPESSPRPRTCPTGNSGGTIPPRGDNVVAAPAHVPDRQPHSRE